MKNLKSLEISLDALKHSDFLNFITFPQSLKKITIDGIMDNIREIDHEVFIKPEKFEVMKNLDPFASIVMRFDGNILKKFKNLKELSLSGPFKNMESLKELKELEYIDIDSKNVFNFEWIKDTRTIKSISTHRCGTQPPLEPCTVNEKYLKNFFALEKLEINPIHAEEALEILKVLIKLK